MKLTDEIQKSLVSARVNFTYANRATIKIWNSMKPAGEPPIFCGWYWMHGTNEGGPFNTESACMRDAWYRVCLKRAPPMLYHAGGVVPTGTHLNLPPKKLKLRLVS